MLGFIEIIASAESRTIRNGEKTSKEWHCQSYWYNEAQRPPVPKAILRAAGHLNRWCGPQTNRNRLLAEFIRKNSINEFQLVWRHLRPNLGRVQQAHRISSRILTVSARRPQNCTMLLTNFLLNAAASYCYNLRYSRYDINSIVELQEVITWRTFGPLGTINSHTWNFRIFFEFFLFGRVKHEVQGPG